MDINEYEIKIKNRLLLYADTKEIRAILDDIEDECKSGEEAEAKFGKANRLSKEIGRENKLNLFYIIMGIGIFGLLMFFCHSARYLPLWVYSTISVVGSIVLIIVISKDYIFQNRIPVTSKDKIIFWIHEVIMILIGFLFTLFTLTIKSYVSIIENYADTGKTIRIFLIMVIVISSLSLIFSFVRYNVAKKLFYGAIIIQSISYIDFSVFVWKRISMVSLMENVYVGNCLLAFLGEIIFVIGYYLYFKKTELYER